MPIYQIARVRFLIEPPDEAAGALMAPYQVAGDAWDARIEPGNAHPLVSVSRVLLDRFEGCYIHGAAITYREKVYLFCAPSGTGKSTHITLWKQMLGDSVQIVNGDKPILRWIEEKPMIFGSPWTGKEGWGKNTCAVLGGIFFLERGQTNSVQELPIGEGLRRFLGATLYPENVSELTKLLQIYTRLRCPIALLTCRPDTGAVKAVLDFLEEYHRRPSLADQLKKHIEES